MPQIGIYIEPDYEQRMRQLRKENESKQDTAVRLLKMIIDMEVPK